MRQNSPKRGTSPRGKMWDSRKKDEGAKANLGTGAGYLKGVFTSKQNIKKKKLKKGRKVPPLKTRRAAHRKKALHFESQSSCPAKDRKR